jgi:hypothetical protein
MSVVMQTVNSVVILSVDTLTVVAPPLVQTSWLVFKNFLQQ